MIRSFAYYVYRTNDGRILRHFPASRILNYTFNVKALAEHRDTEDVVARATNKLLKYYLEKALAAAIAKAQQDNKACQSQSEISRKPLKGSQTNSK